MDQIFDFRLADHITPGLDLTCDEYLMEGILAYTLCDQVGRDRVLGADDREDGILRNGHPESAFGFFVGSDLA